MSSDKTEKPTAKKLQDAKKKGQVAKSKDVVTTAQMATGFIFLWMGWGYFQSHFMALMDIPVEVMDLPFTEALQKAAFLSGIELAYLIIPFVLVLAFVGALGYMAQFGFIFATEALKPSFDKLNPVNGFKNLFSVQTLIDALKSVVIVIVLGIILFFVIKGSLQSIVNVPFCDMDCLLTLTGNMIIKVFMFSVPIFLVVSVIDFAFQKSQFTKNQMMSKEDIKQEHKNSEGDPHVKGERKKVQREMMNESLVEAVRKFGTVIVTAGMKYAVVLWYEPPETPIPIVSFIAKNKQAGHAFALARECRVPVVEDVELVAIMLEKGKINQYIPVDHIDEVAVVIRKANEIRAQWESQAS